MTWHTYKLDEIAQELVLDALKRSKDSLNQSYKMRTTVAFGLERFWGEHVRLLSKDKNEEQQKGWYWHDTWKVFRKTMQDSHIYLPKPLKKGGKPEELKQIAGQFWGSAPIKVGETEVFLTLEDRRIAQAVLTQLCDCLVWWTQRYKP
ncbi:MAG: OCTOPUS family protein [Leptolyngbyaceae cyanobacterium SM2_5_2]|nr:OCTOPUS family protein [Leptolyngbyaceae cyanobacterium SM2_5_2]